MSESKRKRRVTPSHNREEKFSSNSSNHLDFKKYPFVKLKNVLLDKEICLKHISLDRYIDVMKLSTNVSIKKKGSNVLPKVVQSKIEAVVEPTLVKPKVEPYFQQKKQEKVSAKSKVSEIRRHRCSPKDQPKITLAKQDKGVETSHTLIPIVEAKTNNKESHKFLPIAKDEAIKAETYTSNPKPVFKKYPPMRKAKCRSSSSSLSSVCDETNKTTVPKINSESHDTKVYVSMDDANVKPDNISITNIFKTADTSTSNMQAITDDQSMLGIKVVNGDSSIPIECPKSCTSISNIQSNTDNPAKPNIKFESNNISVPIIKVNANNSPKTEVKDTFCSASNIKPNSTKTSIHKINFENDTTRKSSRKARIDKTLLKVKSTDDSSNKKVKNEPTRQPEVKAVKRKLFKDEANNASISKHQYEPDNIAILSVKVKTDNLSTSNKKEKINPPLCQANAKTVEQEKDKSETNSNHQTKLDKPTISNIKSESANFLHQLNLKPVEQKLDEEKSNHLKLFNHKARSDNITKPNVKTESDNTISPNKKAKSIIPLCQSKNTGAKQVMDKGDINSNLQIKLDRTTADSIKVKSYRITRSNKKAENHSLWRPVVRPEEKKLDKTEINETSIPDHKFKPDFPTIPIVKYDTANKSESNERDEKNLPIDQPKVKAEEQKMDIDETNSNLQSEPENTTFDVTKTTPVKEQVDINKTSNKSPPNLQSKTCNLSSVDKKGKEPEFVIPTIQVCISRDKRLLNGQEVSFKNFNLETEIKFNNNQNLTKENNSVTNETSVKTKKKKAKKFRKRKGPRENVEEKDFNISRSMNLNFTKKSHNELVTSGVLDQNRNGYAMDSTDCAIKDDKPVEVDHNVYEFNDAGTSYQEIITAPEAQCDDTIINTGKSESLNDLQDEYNLFRYWDTNLANFKILEVNSDADIFNDAKLAAISGSSSRSLERGIKRTFTCTSDNSEEKMCKFVRHNSSSSISFYSEKNSENDFRCNSSLQGAITSSMGNEQLLLENENTQVSYTSSRSVTYSQFENNFDNKVEDDLPSPDKICRTNFPETITDKNNSFNKKIEKLSSITYSFPNTVFIKNLKKDNNSNNNIDEAIEKTAPENVTTITTVSPLKTVNLDQSTITTENPPKPIRTSFQSRLLKYRSSVMQMDECNEKQSNCNFNIPNKNIGQFPSDERSERSLSVSSDSAKFSRSNSIRTDSSIGDVSIMEDSNSKGSIGTKTPERNWCFNENANDFKMPFMAKNDEKDDDLRLHLQFKIQNSSKLQGQTDPEVLSLFAESLADELEQDILGESDEEEDFPIETNFENLATREWTQSLPDPACTFNSSDYREEPVENQNISPKKLTPLELEVPNYSEQYNCKWGLKMMKQICRTFSHCNSEVCQFMHYIPYEYNTFISTCDELDLSRFYNELIEDNNMYLIKVLFPLIVDKYCMLRDPETLLSLIASILDFTSNRSDFIKLTIESIRKCVPEFTFQKVLSKISGNYGRLHVLLSDILLDMITKEPDFIRQYWRLIKRFVEFRTIELDESLVETVVKAALKCDTFVKTDYENLFKNFLGKKCVNVRKLDKPVFDEIVNKFDHFNLNQYSEFLRSRYYITYNEFKSVNEEIITAKEENTKDMIISPSEDIIYDPREFPVLKHALEGNSDRFEELILKYRGLNVSKNFVCHLIVALKDVKCLKVFTDMILKMHKKYSPLFPNDELLNPMLMSVSFNALPYYQNLGDYKGATAIISAFFDDIDCFLQVQCCWTSGEYKRDLESRDEKLLFFIDFLMNANEFQKAAKLITLLDFNVKGENNPTLFMNKVDKVEDCIGRCIELDMKTAKDLIYYFFDFEPDIQKTLKLHNMYNQYILNLIDKPRTNSKGLIDEFREKITRYYKVLDISILRALIVLLYEEIDIKEMYKIFRHCEKNHCYFSGESTPKNVLVLFSNLMYKEIKLNITMFFIRTLLSNKKPVDVEIRILPNEQTNNFSLMPNIFRQSEEHMGDIKRMKARVSFVLGILKLEYKANDLVYTLPSNSVKLYLEYLRRKPPLILSSLN